jgi:chromosome partitioning protein
MGTVRTVAVMNEKGGSGKTTTTISLAAVLAERGLRVLVIDLDPQASASLWMGRGREPGLYRAITDRADLRPYVRSTAVHGIDLIAASRELAAVDDLRGRMGIQTALKRALVKLGNQWDLVLIDCPPNLGLLAVNALAAADEVLVPVETHGIAAIGLRDLLRTIEDARESQVNPTLAIGAIVATRFNRTKEAKDCVQQTRDAFPREMLQTVVRESARLGEAFSYARTIVEHDPEGMGATDYRAVADELVERWQLPVPTAAAVGGEHGNSED